MAGFGVPLKKVALTRPSAVSLRLTRALREQISPSPRVVDTAITREVSPSAYSFLGKNSENVGKVYNL